MTQTEPDSPETMSSTMSTAPRPPTTAVPPDMTSQAHPISLGLLVPLIFIGVFLFVAVVCWIWHAYYKTGRNSTGASSRRRLEQSFRDRLPFGRFREGRGSKSELRTEFRDSMLSEAPIGEHAIPNDYIPPVFMPAKRIAIGTPKVGQQKQSTYRNFDAAAKPYITADSTNSDSDIFTPNLSTVTEEDPAWVNKTGKGTVKLNNETSPGYIPGMTRSDPYLFEQRSPINKEMYHLTWVNPELTPGYQAKLDKRQVRSDPNISSRNRSSVVSSIPSLETVTEMSAEHLAHECDHVPVRTGFTTASYPSPFHPQHNTPTGGSENEVEIQVYHSSMYPCNVMSDCSSSKVKNGAPDRLASLNSSYPSSYTSSSSYAQDVMQAISESGRKIRLYRAKEDRSDMSFSSTTSSDDIARPRPRGLTFENHGSDINRATANVRPDFPHEDLARRFRESINSSANSNNISSTGAIAMHAASSALTTETSESIIPDSTGGTMLLFDSGLQAPPASKNSSAFATDKSLSLTQSKLYPVELFEPNLRQVLSASRTSSHRSHGSRSRSRLRNVRPRDYILDFHTSIALPSTDTSMCPQVGSSCNTSEIHTFHPGLDNSEGYHDFVCNEDAVASLSDARKTGDPRLTDKRLRTASDIALTGITDGDCVPDLVQRRAYSQDDQESSQGSSVIINNDYEWDSYYPCPFEDAARHAQEQREFHPSSPIVGFYGATVGQPVLSTKQYWV